MKLLKIPLLCKERPGEVEFLCPRKAMMGSAIVGCEEPTSPRYCLMRPAGRDRCLQRRGTPERSALVFTHTKVRRTIFRDPFA